MGDCAVIAAERLLVCVGPSSSCAEVIKAAQSMAANVKAAWFVVYVEDPKMLRKMKNEGLGQTT